MFDLFTFLNISFCFLLKDEKWFRPEGWNFTQPIFHKYFLASYCRRFTLQDTLQILEPKSHFESLNTAIRQQSSLKVLNSYLYPETASVYYQQTLPHKIYCLAWILQLPLWLSGWGLKLSIKEKIRLLYSISWAAMLRNFLVQLLCSELFFERVFFSILLIVYIRSERKVNGGGRRESASKNWNCITFSLNFRFKKVQ